MIVRSRGHVTVRVKVRVRVRVRVETGVELRLRVRLGFMLGFMLRFSIGGVGLGLICHIDSWRARSRLASSSASWVCCCASSSWSMRSARARGMRFPFRIVMRGASRWSVGGVARCARCGVRCGVLGLLPPSRSSLFMSSCTYGR